MGMRKANIVIFCHDARGIIRAVTDFLFNNSGNIVYLEEHTEDDYFFMRVSCELDRSVFKHRADFYELFQPIKDQFKMDVKIDFEDRVKSVGLFCSKEGHCVMDILSRRAINEFKIDIPYVISNYDDCRDMVGKFGVPFYLIKTKKDSFEHEEECLKIVQQHKTDVIGLARYMKVLSADFIEAVGQKIINVHHSFLPSFVGGTPYQDAYARGVKLIGATSHYVTTDLDQGPIIEQEVKRVKHGHQVDDLKLTTRECEKRVFAFAIKKHINNKILVFNKRTIIFD